MATQVTISRVPFANERVESANEVDRKVGRHSGRTGETIVRRLFGSTAEVLWDDKGHDAPAGYGMVVRSRKSMERIAIVRVDYGITRY